MKCLIPIIALALACYAGDDDHGKTLAKDAPGLRGQTCGKEPPDTWRECHTDFLTGCTTGARPGYDPYLNFLKNQYDGIDGLKSTKTFTKIEEFNALDEGAVDLLSKGTHQKKAVAFAALGEGNIHTIMGFLYYAFPSGSETSNCKLDGARDVDFHIGIGFDADTGEQLWDNEELDQKQLEKESVVVEMTPHYRGWVKGTWTISKLEKLMGRQVKVVGQLIADTEHAKGSDVCVLANSPTEKKKCWRHSMWELHPVSEFYVCTTKTPCEENSADWKALDDFKKAKDYKRIE